MTTIPDYIQMFPEVQDVFADKIEEHANVLFPLFSIDLKQINKSWDGRLHLLHFNEDPYNEETVSSFNTYCKDRMFAFDVVDHKYSFKTDFKYFDLTPDWVEWFEKTKTIFNKARSYYLENEVLPKSPYGVESIPFEQIGGKAEWIQGDETPLNPDGNPMTFICRVNTANYTSEDMCPKVIYLFYCDKHKLAVQLYQID